MASHNPLKDRLHFLKSFVLQSKKASQKWAASLANVLDVGDAIFLCGALGAGKTAFAQFIIEALSDQEVCVQSPTFPLQLTYATRKGTVMHNDLYRLSQAEAAELALDEQAEEAIHIIEWPERLKSWPHTNMLWIDITKTKDEHSEERTLSLYSDHTYKKRLNQLIETKSFRESTRC